ncbi:hypothetical protein MXD62_38020 [Frankia sp. Mgl5]|uniref:hypothetical protein n=1 Tax=Frankia sp. Mgl5 TaxID=2933793 RepID=UPI00200EC5D1|nr:hypothetical protein [Frankia sp. Mgl5]MCK9932874.1 hypothetical protein [Frankia sp. Mgl5]
MPVPALDYRSDPLPGIEIFDDLTAVINDLAFVCVFLFAERLSSAFCGGQSSKAANRASRSQSPMATDPVRIEYMYQATKADPRSASESIGTATPGSSTGLALTLAYSANYALQQKRRPRFTRAALNILI